MPSSTTQYPEFPSDVSIANIPIISLTNLENQSEKESKRLFETCTEHGFFLLDLANSEEGAWLSKNAEAMFEIGAKTFALGPEELKQYAYKPPSLIGYKPIGILPTDDGKRDNTEVYTIGQDDIFNPTASRKNPETVESHRKDCEAFFRRAHRTICILLSHLDKQLALAPGTLAALSPLDKPSETSLRFLLSQPEPAVETHTRVALPGHTDIGTITMLFHTIGGLQILPANNPNTEFNWRYIRPEPSCALINIGDTLVEWTGGVLRSALHRVVAPPGKQASVARQSLAYLVRADRSATMRRLKSDGVVPVPGKEEVEETCGVDEWAARRVGEISRGEVRPKGRGGRFVGYGKLGKEQ